MRRCTDDPNFFLPMLFLCLIHDRIRFAFYQEDIYFPSYDTYHIWDVTKSCQIMPRWPKFPMTGKRGEHVQKTCSDGISILYTCILGYVHTFLSIFLRIWTGIWFLQGSWEKVQSSSWDFPKSWEFCTGWRFDHIVIKHPPQVVYHGPGGYSRPYGTYGDLTRQFPASNSKKKYLSLAWLYIGYIYMGYLLPNVDRLIFGQLWVSPDVMIGYVDWWVLSESSWSVETLWMFNQY